MKSKHMRLTSQAATDELTTAHARMGCRFFITKGNVAVLNLNTELLAVLGTGGFFGECCRLQRGLWFGNGWFPLYNGNCMTRVFI